MNEAPFAGLEIGLYSVSSTRDNLLVAQRAEARGFKRVWLAEDHHSRDVIVQATAVAQGTGSIEIALGIVNPYTRHPAQITMAVADLEELAGPRLVLGLGAAWSAITAHGLERPQPILALAEASEIFRGLIAGERINFEGEVFQLPVPGVKLGFRPIRNRVPLYFGTMGPKTLKMVVPRADGILFSVFSSPAFIKDRIAHVHAALDAAGRSIDDIDVACYIIFSVDYEGSTAREAAKWVIAHYLRRIPDPTRAIIAGLDADQVTGLQTELRAAFEGGSYDAAVAAVPNDVVNALAVAGTPAECIERLQDFAAVGIKTPVLYHTLGPDRAAAIDLIADEIRPALVAGD